MSSLAQPLASPLARPLANQLTGTAAVAAAILARFPGAAYAGAAQDLGNRRGVVTFTGRSVNSVYNPTWDLRRGSDDAERAFTWPQIRDGVAEAWIGSGVNAYLITQYDQSGNDNDATQSTAASQALVYDGADWTRDSAGNIAAQFDGVDDYLGTSLTIGNINNCSVYAIFAQEDTLAIAVQVSGNPSRFMVAFPDGVNWRYGYDDSAAKITGDARDTATRLHSMVATPSGVEAFLDGVSQGTTAAVNESGVSTLNLGSTGNFTGTIKAVLVYDEGHDSTTRAAIEAALAAKYGITLS